MKAYSKVLFSVVMFLAFVLLFAGTKAQASVTPTLSISVIDSSNSRVTVSGNPHSAVELHYGPSAGAIRVIGTTDQNGNFTMTVRPDTYNLSACNQTAYVIVDGQQSPTITWSAGGVNGNSCATSSTGYPNFSQNNVILGVGQNLAITIIGNGGYSISNNSNSNIISATINGGVINLYASAFGGANINVCESDGQCSTLYVVSVNSNVVQTTSTTSLAALTSFSVASNDANGYFMNAGAILTLSFNMNQQVSNVAVSINGSLAGVSGNGNGPYTATYNVTGNETQPIPVAVSFLNLDGRASQTSFSLGGVAAPISTSGSSSGSNVTSNTSGSLPAGCTGATRFSTITGQACGNFVDDAPGTPSTSSTSLTTSSGDGYVFSDFIAVGSSGSKVTELQKRLKALGFFSGPINGNFGPMTEAAVKKFQSAHGISPAGYVGPSTRTALNHQ